jgi:chorismate--pyruvate lyase
MMPHQPVSIVPCRAARPGLLAAPVRPRTLLAWRPVALGAPRALQRWLTDRGSLTERLRTRATAVTVQVQHQGVRPGYFDELANVGLPRGRRALVRDVWLLCDGVPVIFAHSITSLEGRRHGWRRLDRLGNRSLGSALFANPRIRRQQLTMRRLRPPHPLHRAVSKRLALGQHPLWARRSVFVLRRQPLLVTEVFLPAWASLPQAPLATSFFSKA